MCGTFPHLQLWDIPTLEFTGQAIHLCRWVESKSALVARTRHRQGGALYCREAGLRDTDLLEADALVHPRRAPDRLAARAGARGQLQRHREQQQQRRRRRRRWPRPRGPCHGLRGRDAWREPLRPGYTDSLAKRLSENYAEIYAENYAERATPRATPPDAAYRMTATAATAGEPRRAASRAAGAG